MTLKVRVWPRTPFEIFFHWGEHYDVNCTVYLYLPDVEDVQYMRSQGKV